MPGLPLPPGMMMSGPMGGPHMGGPMQMGGPLPRPMPGHPGIHPGMGPPRPGWPGHMGDGGIHSHDGQVCSGLHHVACMQLPHCLSVSAWRIALPPLWCCTDRVKGGQCG